MMRSKVHSRHAWLAGTAVAAVMASAAAAQPSHADFSIAAGDLGPALAAYAKQSGVELFYQSRVVQGRQTGGLTGSHEPQEGLNQLIAGTGLVVAMDSSGALVVREAADPQSGSAAGDGADGTVEALIVTAQKREEDIQDVPIAISAFTQEALERSQVAGGPDLITQVPNMTFTKTNFSSYSIQLRGIGTQAISATTDAAVAVAFNNTPFIRNRFFEQEFFDLQRVEVLRGPQGTLYGRNATAGVVNIISAKPKFNYEAKLSGDVANYKSTRIEGMVNVPLVEDIVALRLAGAWTKRNGYVENEITGNPIDGRDLWSTRVSLRVAPTDRIEANLIWEHFEEDDDRLRSGKQLCKTHNVTNVAGIDTTHYEGLPELGQGSNWAGVDGTFSQGCLANSLYDKDSFQTPNGISLPYYLPLGAVGLPTGLPDPYISRTQSTDLRVIESTVDPEYRAKSDVTELQLSVDLSDSLTLASETAYSSDVVFSMQDFNRFNTAPGAWGGGGGRPELFTDGPNGAVFCDPQLGCSDRLVAQDLSTAKSRQFSQEFRLSSDFDGPFNFSLGANFLRYDTEDKYYVFINSVSIISAISTYGSTISSTPYIPGVSTNVECMRSGRAPGIPIHVYQVPNCTYLDPNPIGSLNDLGHNYFLSKNPYKLISYAAFGEAYYNVTDNLKVTAGLRWTVDKKEAPRIPSWLLASQSVGYPVAEVIEQEWREPTGRLTVDWKPDLAFTDETLLYASYAHGYKAGGANPPGMVNVYYGSAITAHDLTEHSATRPKTFAPEFVDAFEVGSKNTFLEGRMTLNLAAFYYDYEGYQISEIVDRSAYNHNYDAEVWGLEVEADWRPLENLRLGFKGGYESTRIADGMMAVDVMDRTAGDPNWIINKPFPTAASNCILPVALFAGIDPDTGEPRLHNLGGKGGGNPGGCEIAYQMNLDPVTQLPYVPDPTVANAPGVGSFFPWHPGYKGFNPETAPNHGEGISKDLSGNELPNAPHFTATITADYSIPLPNDWLATLHTDLYYQSEAWTRIFNTEGYDKLKAYTNVNLAAIFTNDEAGWKVMAYVKNVFDRDSITGSFLNSDDTGLTTNVFLTEPRLYGIRVTKDWSGGSLLGPFGQHREGPFPLTVELGGQLQRHDAPNELYRPGFMNAFGSLDQSHKQDGDLDWGDGREVRLTYAPGPWKLTATVRFGKTNGGGRTMITGQVFPVCNVAVPCDVEPAQKNYLTDYGASLLADKEDHTIVDFTIGRDLGIGLGASSSTLSFGLRYADFRSRTDLSLYGTPDFDPPEKYFLVNEAFHTVYDAELRANRAFRGAGPILSWEASRRLFDGGDIGHADLDWSVTGGALFGKQKASGDGGAQAVALSPKYSQFPAVPDSVVASSFAFDRAQSRTTPLLGGSLGLSYNVSRFGVAAGYRWERYFDAIDGGVRERKSYDRTIDGPYFKVSLGFGG